MNRSKDFQVLSQNPEAAGQVAKAVRKGIVRGFFAVKNFDKKLTEEKIREIYKVPKGYFATWMSNGTVVFSMYDSDITVHPDGSARESHMSTTGDDGPRFTDAEWEP